jgi:hypothetical protein
MTEIVRHEHLLSCSLTTIACIVTGMRQLYHVSLRMGAYNLINKEDQRHASLNARLKRARLVRG